MGAMEIRSKVRWLGLDYGPLWGYLDRFPPKRSTLEEVVEGVQVMEAEAIRARNEDDGD